MKWNKNTCFTAWIACLCAAYLSAGYADPLFGPTVNQQYLSLNMGVPYAQKLYFNNTTYGGFSGVSAGLALGEQFKRVIGPELMFQYDNFNTSGESFLFGATARGTLNFDDDKWSLFGKLGIGYAQVRTCVAAICGTEGNMTPVFGGGIGGYVGEGWLATVEFNGVYFANMAVHNADGVLGGLTLGITRFLDL